LLGLDVSMIKVEEWRAIPGLEGSYEVSSLGRVKSLPRIVLCSNNRSQLVKGGILKLTKSQYGYLQTSVSIASTCRTRNVHILVALAFIGPRPEGLIVLHGENGQLDNSVGNLSYGTHKLNAQHRHRDGTACTGEKNHKALLTVEKVWLARAVVPNGPRGTLQRLAEEWGVHRSTLGYAVSGKHWAHI
jgi:NUMOD4 motif/HNH endonuclease